MTEGRRHLPGHPPGPANRGSSYWNPASWRDGPFGGWGEAHLNLDAIVAYVDDELTPSARGRATEHLARCRDCVREVSAQLQARSALRSATAPTLPVSLLDALRAIPGSVELPPPPPGLAVGPNGELVSVLREEPKQRSTGARPQPTGPDHRSLGGSPAWFRFGAGAVAGLALGALIAAAMPFHPGSVARPAGGPQLDARFQLGPQVPVRSVRFGEPSSTPDPTSNQGPSIPQR